MILRRPPKPEDEKPVPLWECLPNGDVVPGNARAYEIQREQEKAS